MRKEKKVEHYLIKVAFKVTILLLSVLVKKQCYAEEELELIEGVIAEFDKVYDEEMKGEVE